MFMYEERRDMKGMWMGMQGRRLVCNTPEENLPQPAPSRFVF